MKSNEDASFEMQNLTNNVKQKYEYQSPDGKKEKDINKNGFTPKILNENQV